LKANTSNEDHSKKVKLQNDELLACLKSINEHVMHNVLKQWQYLIDGTTRPFSPLIPSSFYIDLDPHSNMHNMPLTLVIAST
jgi:hypothetical protein